MHRFYAEGLPDGEGRAFLCPEDTRHALKVLRLKPGDEIEVMAEGLRYQGEIIGPEGDRIALRCQAELASTEPKLKITLYQGLPKADKMEWIVQKAVELGAHRIVPVVMARCVAQIAEKDMARKTERWQKIAREACKQSGRSELPEIAPPTPLRQLGPELQQNEVNAVPWEECETGGPLAFRQAHPTLASLGIIIGPEGGIEAGEIAWLRENGCAPITLGKRILRTETAGLAAISAFLTLYGEME